MLESTLLNLVEAIRNHTFKSKQACFDYYLDDLLEVKKFHLWQDIADYINKETNDSLSTETYKFMIKRSRNRRKAVNNKEKTVPSKSIPNKNSESVTGTKEAKKVVRSPYELKQLMKKSINLEELDNPSEDE